MIFRALPPDDTGVMIFLVLDNMLVWLLFLIRAHGRKE